MSQKRIAAIHDISGVGKCSLTVALPICSAAGIETAVIPTAVLSTHTGGFKNFTFRDLTDDIMPIAKHWKENGFEFEAIYTGYLGSARQIELVKEAADLISSEKTLLICDPAMADHGKMYVGFDLEFAKNMLTLCASADVIVPNITEAALMLGKEYVEGPYTKEYIEDLIKELHKATNSKIVLTGVHFDDDLLGAACFDGEKLEYAFEQKIDASFHGTGDVFASAFTSALVSGHDLLAAAKVAAKFTCRSILHTMENDPTRRYGVNFEQELPYLISYLEK